MCLHSSPIQYFYIYQLYIFRMNGVYRCKYKRFTRLDFKKKLAKKSKKKYSFFMRKLSWLYSFSNTWWFINHDSIFLCCLIIFLSLNAIFFSILLSTRLLKNRNELWLWQKRRLVLNKNFRYFLKIKNIIPFVFYQK